MKYVALLRAINLGKRNRILMVDLKEYFNQLGYTNVATYIHTGNVVFETQETEPLILEKQIEEIIDDNYDFTITVMVRTMEEVDRIVTYNPITENNPLEHVLITFLKHEPLPSLVRALESGDYGDDYCKVQGKEIYLFCKGKYSESKLGNTLFEKKLKVQGTTRNWKVTTKLLSM